MITRILIQILFDKWVLARSAMGPVGVNNVVPCKTLLKVSEKYYSCGAFQLKKKKTCNSSCVLFNKKETKALCYGQTWKAESIQEETEWEL